MLFIYNSVKLPNYSKCHNKFIFYQKVDFCISELKQTMLFLISLIPDFLLLSSFTYFNIELFSSWSVF